MRLPTPTVDRRVPSHWYTWFSLALSLGVLGSLATSPAHSAETAAQTLGNLLGADGQMAGMTRLPVGGMTLIETTEGKLFVASDTGRYAVVGTLYDLWHGARVESLDQAKRLAARIDLKRLGIDLADLGALDVGTGPEVVAFVDPDCPHCADLFKVLPSLTDRYRFRLIVLPVAQDSGPRALALHCLRTTDAAAARKALLEHSADVPPATGTCGQVTVQRTLITARVFGVGGTPFLVAPDGRTQTGLPADLSGWLAGAPAVAGGAP